MEDQVGIGSEFTFAREVEGIVSFNHGPECECGSEFSIPLAVWRQLGSPMTMIVAVIPVEEEVVPVLGQLFGPVI